MTRAWVWRAATLLGLLATPPADAAGLSEQLAAQAPINYSAPDCADAAPPGDAEAQLQYLEPLHTLLAWRQWPMSGGWCVQLDWPEVLRLPPAASAGLQQLLSQQADRRRALLSQALPRSQVGRGELRQSPPAWLPAVSVPAPSGRPTLPLCPRVPALATLQPLELPSPLAATVLRVRPHRCRPGGLPMAGSGVLLAPGLALTAAHVVMTPGGMVCDRYRVVPGGRRFTDPPAAPYGMGFVSRAVLSERGGWQRDAGVAPPPNADYDQRTAHDYAFLLLDTPATVPADSLWPRLRFGAPPSVLAQPLLMAGYGHRAPTGPVAPGAMVSLWGQITCPRGQESYQRQALWMSAGASGGPIWHYSPARPLELSSLGVRVETLSGDRYETLGPRFDLVDYSALLQMLARENLTR